MCMQNFITIFHSVQEIGPFSLFQNLELGKASIDDKCLFATLYQCVCKSLTKYSKRYQSYGHVSVFVKGHILHKLSGDKIKSLIIGHTLNVNLQLRLTFYGRAICLYFIVINIMKKKKTLHTFFHYLLFPDYATYFYHLSDIRLANTLICFRFPSVAKELSHSGWNHHNQSNTDSVHAQALNFLHGRTWLITTCRKPYETYEV